MDSFIDSLGKMPTAAEMRLWDKAAIDFGLPETMLMENSARAAFETAVDLWGDVGGKTVWLFMGGGNNGGDAAAMARLLRDACSNAVIFSTKSRDAIKGSPAWHLELAIKNGACFFELPDDGNPAADSLWNFCLTASGDAPVFMVDALLGTGFSGPLKPRLQQLIKAINGLAKMYSLPLLAMDIPSGLNVGTGEPEPDAILASATITLAAPKYGLMLAKAKEYTGQVICRSIGLPQAVAKSAPALWRLLDGEACLYPMPAQSDTFKNTYGHVFVVGGALGYAGAAHIAALAALRSGAGLATVCAPENSLPAIKGSVPEIMTLSAGQGMDWPDTPGQETLAALGKADALIIGPGMGRSRNAALFLSVVLSLSQRPPAIIDADALFALSRQPDLSKYISPADIFTPHPGEAGFLLGVSARAVQEDRKAALDMLCEKYSAAIALKGADTILGQGQAIRILCPYDIPQLAIAGAGDALAGCIGGLRSQKNLREQSSIDLAALGVILHAMTGLCLAKKYPNRGMLASELADNLPHARTFAAKTPKPVKGMLPWPA